MCAPGGYVCQSIPYISIYDSGLNSSYFTTILYTFSEFEVSVARPNNRTLLLSSNAPSSRPLDMELCDFCSRVIERLTVIDFSEIHEKRTRFQESSKYCQLCKLICGHFQDWTGKPITLLEKEHPPYSIEVFTNKKRSDPSEVPISRITFRLQHMDADATIVTWADGGNKYPKYPVVAWKQS